MPGDNYDKNFIVARIPTSLWNNPIPKSKPDPDKKMTCPSCGKRVKAKQLRKSQSNRTYCTRKECGGSGKGGKKIVKRKRRSRRSVLQYH